MNTFWLSTSAHLQFACVVFAFVSYLLIPKGERKAFQLVWLFLSASLLSEVSGFVGGFLLRKNMNLISNIQAMAVGPTLLLFYRQQISFEQYKSLASAAILSLFAFGIVDLIWIQGPMAPNSYVKICNSFCLITSGVIYFFSLARDLPHKSAFFVSDVLDKHIDTSRFFRRVYGTPRDRLSIEQPPRKGLQNLDCDLDSPQFNWSVIVCRHRMGVHFGEKRQALNSAPK